MEVACLDSSPSGNAQLLCDLKIVTSHGVTSPGSHFLTFKTSAQLCHGSLSPPPVWWLTRETQRTQDIIVLRAMIYYAQQNQTEISKGKSTWGKVQRKPDTSYWESSPKESHRICLIPPTSYDRCEMVSTREAHQRLGARFSLQAGHLGTLCFLYTKISNSQKGSRC